MSSKEFQEMHAQPGGAYAEAMRQLDTARARLAEVEADRDWWIKRYHSLLRMKVIER